MENYLTPEGLEKLKKELDTLENVTRRELAEKLNYAISFGDLKENAAYHQAKEQQGFLEGRISELKSIIGGARVVDHTDSDHIQIGSTVVLACGAARDEYQIVGPDEADIFSGKISYKSPLGDAIFGKRAGCKIILETPKGKMEYEILKIK
ncbi:MAG: transcription elongation factor GreA [Candidatus Nealsonbacteria bacterium DGGOD1a]|jgi:transcription elongation factor GreA|nr:MAG: transcription elongation factor GreA [Candidatus Nealsonbacteria bacterium DGGOD1a]